MSRKKFATLTVALLLVVTSVACDRFEQIDFQNDTTLTIDIVYGHSTVPDELGKRNSSGRCAVCELPPGEEDLLIDPSGDPDRGRDVVYSITARDAARDVVIYSRVFTWDELSDMDWRVVITDMRE